MFLSGDAAQLVEILVFIITAVWAISKIRASTQVLTTSLNHLNTTVNKLDVKLERISSELGGLRDRMTVIETKFGMHDNVPTQVFNMNSTEEEK